MDSATTANCPICKTTWEECACEKPISLKAIPEHHLQGIARSLIPALEAYYDKPDNMAKFEAWQAERQNVAR